MIISSHTGRVTELDELSEAFDECPIDIEEDGVYVKEGHCCRCLEPCDDLYDVAVVEGDVIIPVFGLCEKCMDEVGVFVYQRAELMAAEMEPKDVG